MRAESKEKLPMFGKSRGKIIFRFDFKQIEKQMEDGKAKAGWEFQQVMIEPPVDRARLIEAVISSRYAVRDEIALINNKINNQDANSDAAIGFQDYQDFRIQAKKWVDNVEHRLGSI